MSEHDKEARPAQDELSHEDQKRSISLILGFCALHQACRLYDLKNAVVRKVLDEMLVQVQGISKGKDPVLLTTAGYSFFLNRLLVRMSYTEYKKAQQLKEIWGKLAISEVVFPADTTIQGLEEFAARFVAAIKDPAEVPTLTRRPYGGISARLVLGGSAEDTTEENALACDLAVRVYGGLVVLVSETIQQFKEDRWTTLLRIKRTLQVLVDKMEMHENLLVALTRTPVFREELASHLANVTVLSLILGRRLELGRKDLIALATAALFHDLSKVGVNAETLNNLEKGGALQPQARERISAYWNKTLYQMVKVGGLREETLPRLVVAYESQLEFSQEQLYPESLAAKGKHSLFGHIISLCDRFDTLTWSRPGKPTIPGHQALLRLFHASGALYEPGLWRTFVETIGLYPSGTVVRLSTGELAVVMEQDPGRDLERPLVVLVADGRGKALPGTEEVNLVADRSRRILSDEDGEALGINPIACFLKRDGARAAS